MACAVSPVPEANGYSVQLEFGGAPLGGSLVVGSPEIVTVRRIEQRMDRCTTNVACDPTTETPIALVSATCDDGVCTVSESTTATSDGSVALEASGARSGSTTLRVRVRSLLDGSEWDDSYPLTFKSATPAFVRAPAMIQK